MSVPSALPTVVPAGRYLCEIASDPVQKASTFPGQEGKFYLQINLKIRSEKGEWFEYPLSTSLKSPRYHAILQACGGKLLPNGVTQPPDVLVGKQFMAEIGKKLSQDNKRTVNELLEVWPCAAPQPVSETEKSEKQVTDDEEEPDPF